MTDLLDRLTTALSDRYRIAGELGEGGMATVYLAQDLKHERKVAVKVLKPELAAIMGTERFLTEIRTTANLTHPHILPLHDSGEADGFLFYVMPYVEGETVRSLLEREKRLSLEQALTIGRQVASALDHAHRKNIVHRDIKPENILLQDGIALLADFGIALAVESAGGERLTRTGLSLGTPSYMSPEQAAGEKDLDGRSDLYSLACVLYELLAGDPPFVASNAQAVLARHIVDPPPPLSTVRQSVGKVVSDVLGKALGKVPADRFPTVAVFSDALWSAATPGEATRRPPSTVKSPLMFRPRAHTVGREEVLRLLSGDMESVGTDHGRFLCVTGEAGIGKTTVVESFLGELAVADPAPFVGRGRCSERLAGTEAYLPILEALETLVSSGPDLRPTLRTVSPGWAAQTGTEGAAGSDGDQVMTSQERLKREFTAFLQEASRERPLVLVLEDLHWGDHSTVDLLSYLGDRLDTMKVMVLVTYRSAEMRKADHPFLGVKAHLQARGVLREIPLGFLGAGDVARYLELEFPRNALDRGFSTLIHQRTEGNPLFMVDLIRDLKNQGVIRQRDGVWQLDRMVSEVEGELPQSIRSMIQRKLDRLSEEDRALLRVASVQGYEFHGAVVAEVMGTDPANTEERLQSFEHVHELVSPIGEEDLPDGTFTVRYQFVHVLYQNALYEGIPPTKRVALSRAVAGNLTAHYGGAVTGIAAELAYLFEAGRDFEKAVSFYLTAARNAASLFANHEAVQYADRGLSALQRLPEGPERLQKELDLEMAKGPALLITRGYTSPEVKRTYARAEELTEKVENPAQLLSVLVGLFYYRGLHDDLRAAKGIALRIMDLVEGRLDPDFYLPAAHQLMASVLAWTGEWEGALEYAIRGLELYDRKSHTHLLQIVPQDPKEAFLAFSGYSLWFQGYLDQAWARYEEALAWARELNHGNSIAEALSFAGVMAAEVKEVEKAIELGNELRRRGVDDGIPDRIFLSQMIEGRIEILKGNLRKGIDLLNQEAPFALLTGVFGAWLAGGYLLDGQYEECLEIAERGLALIPHTGDHQYEPENHRWRGEALAAAAESGVDSLGPNLEERAEDAFGEAFRVAREQGAHFWELRAAMSLSRLWYAQGRTTEARKLLESVFAWFTEGFAYHDLREAKALLQELDHAAE